MTAGTAVRCGVLVALVGTAAALIRRGVSAAGRPHLGRSNHPTPLWDVPDDVGGLLDELEFLNRAANR